jgi:hypothetical protein
MPIAFGADHVAKKRSGHAGKRPVADVLIEAFAQRFQGLITRNSQAFYQRATGPPMTETHPGTLQGSDTDGLLFLAQCANVRRYSPLLQHAFP